MSLVATEQLLASFQLHVKYFYDLRGVTGAEFPSIGAWSLKLSVGAYGGGRAVTLLSTAAGALI